MVVINGTTGIDTIQASSIPNGSITSAKIVDGAITDADLGLSVKPCFKAYRSSSLQAISAGAWSKIQFNSKEYDTTNAFDASTNFRFQPTRAGYYFANCVIGLNNIAGLYIVNLYKNGTSYASGIANNITTAGLALGTYASVQSQVYLNGTTDYIEVYAYSSVSQSIYNSTGEYSRFEAHYIGA